MYYKMFWSPELSDIDIAKCKDIYEVLSFPIIFQAIDELISDLDYDWDSSRKSRADFLRKKWNIEQIINYFQDPDNWANNITNFSNRVEELRVEHQDALSRIWITNEHIDTYILALHSIINFNRIETLWTALEAQNLVDEFNFRFLALIDSTCLLWEIRWDARWNLATLELWKRWEECIEADTDFDFLRWTRFVDDILINWETRQPVLVAGSYSIAWNYIWDTTEDITGKKIINLLLKDNDSWKASFCYVSQDLDIYKVWKYIFNWYGDGKKFSINWNAIKKVDVREEFIERTRTLTRYQKQNWELLTLFWKEVEDIEEIDFWEKKVWKIKLFDWSIKYYKGKTMYAVDDINLWLEPYIYDWEEVSEIWEEFICTDNFWRQVRLRQVIISHWKKYVVWKNLDRPMWDWWSGQSFITSITWSIASLEDWNSIQIGVRSGYAFPREFYDN